MLYTHVFLIDSKMAGSNSPPMEGCPQGGVVNNYFLKSISVVVLLTQLLPNDDTLISHGKI